jgi:CCR4-NOT transcription complex subunit 9
MSLTPGLNFSENVGYLTSSAEIPVSSRSSSTPQQHLAADRRRQVIASSTLSSIATAHNPTQFVDTTGERVHRLISELLDVEMREQAIEELWKIRQDVPDLGVLLWYSFGAVAALIQEIVSVYPSLYPCVLMNIDSSRVTHALSLLQLCALHDDTKSSFFNSHMPQLMLPFLTSTDVNRESEMPRFTVIAMFASLLNTEDRREAIQYILNNNILPIFLRIIQIGTELSKTVRDFSNP